MIVMKFGGTSVGSAEMISQVSEIILSNPEQKVVVVSAASGVTDLLILAAERASKGDASYENSFFKIKEKEDNISFSLFEHTLPEVDTLLEELKNILNGIFVIGELTERAKDTVKSFGERISARIVSEQLKKKGVKSIAVDATKFLITDSNFGNAFPLFKDSQIRARKLFSRFFKDGVTPVVTGFIGATKEGKTTTLGRGGSDFSATILGRLLDAREVWIWTDVNGVMTADPRIVKNARSLKTISYNEAGELSYFGAKVIHPKALLPVADRGIPVRILNTFEPSFPGTLIMNKETEKGFVKAITRIKDTALISINGRGMLGIPGIAERVFKCAAETRSNVFMISQSSSEQNICFAVSKSDSSKLINALKAEFSEELKEGAIDSISSENKVAVVSAVGAGIKSAPNVSGKIFSALGRNGINILAIAQGSSDYNVSFALKEKNSADALNVLHTELGLFSESHSGRKIVNIFQFGVGKVGAALFELIKDNALKIAERTGVELRYAGIARSNGFYIGQDVMEYVDKNGFDFKHSTLAEERLFALPENTVLVDVTNSDGLHPLLIKALQKGLNVVTSNKKNIVDFENFRKFNSGKGIFKFETTVGAALPVIKTIHQLLESGDKIKKITALPSGSLSFIFGMFNSGVPLINSINKAMELGYTEPNPMDDLKGTDIFRKGKILLNVLGRNEKLFFEEFVRSQTLESFEKNELKDFEGKLLTYSKKGKVFPVLKIEEGKAEVSVSAFDKSSSFFSLLPGENIFEIYTECYGDVPIVIKGKGAGAEITASGVLNDIIEIGREL
jgi:aspartokinase/homoserine dehydrogenase 1